METLAAEVVDRLRSARSLSWLRAIDAAELDAPVEEEPDAEIVVAPYIWLLGRVGDGVKLTQAGYLPLAMVTAAMTELGWTADAFDIDALNADLELYDRHTRQRRTRLS